MSRKRFIDKKNSVSFQLLHRSQRDPLVADESAPQRVLAEAEPLPGQEHLTRRQKNAKYGIYFDDDYNYLQHIKESSKPAVVWVEDAVCVRKERGEASDRGATSAESDVRPSLQLPSSLFASHVEEKVGLLNRTAPDHRPPTVVESELARVMDDSFEQDPENELEDNFFDLAGGMPSDNEDEEEIELEVVDQGLDSEPDFASDQGETDMFDENAMFNRKSGKSSNSVFTEYSTTSQGVLSTVSMGVLNERFENFMEDQYQDLGVGGLESDYIAGLLDPGSDCLLQLAHEYEKEKEKPAIEKCTLLKKIGEDFDEDVVYLTVHESSKDEMNCESILSTYSTKVNMPAVIDDVKPISKIKVDQHGMAHNDKTRLTKKALAKLNKVQEDCNLDSDDDLTDSVSSFGNETIATRISMLSIRPGGETSVERRARKSELKVLRRERLEEKRANRCLTKLLLGRQAQSRNDRLKTKQIIQYS